VKAVGITAKELPYNLPIRTGGGRMALLTGGITVYMDVQPGSQAPLFGPAQQLFAGGEGV
jgi:hypothetical protein